MALARSSQGVLLSVPSSCRAGRGLGEEVRRPCLLKVAFLGWDFSHPVFGPRQYLETSQTLLSLQVLLGVGAFGMLPTGPWYLSGVVGEACFAN